MTLPSAEQVLAALPTCEFQISVLTPQHINYDRIQDVEGKLVRITDAIATQIEAHARLQHPAECCGLLSGSNGLITDIHQLRNDADKPETRYFATPEQLFAAMRRIRESGQTLLGVYHSHPRTPPYPSASDVEMAFYPEAFYFIISLEPNVKLRAFKIEDSKIEDVHVSITNF